MNVPSLPAPMHDLSRHGGACRCLLRLLENEGRPWVSDAAFLDRFGTKYPEWDQWPGKTDTLAVFDLARLLGLATAIDVSRDFEQVLRAHRSGQAVLVKTERVPLQEAGPGERRNQVTLLTSIDEGGFALWCPYESGGSDVLPRAGRAWWDAWMAVGIILSKPGPAPADGPAPPAS